MYVQRGRSQRPAPSPYPPLQMNDIQCYLAAKRATKKDEEAKKAKKEWDALDFVKAGATAEEYMDFVWERILSKDI